MGNPEIKSEAQVQPDDVQPITVTSEVLRTDRKVTKFFLWYLLTFGFYSLWALTDIARDINLIAKKDGRHSSEGVIIASPIIGIMSAISLIVAFELRSIFHLVLSIIGFVLFIVSYFIWFHRISKRIGDELVRRNIQHNFSTDDFLIWFIFGSLLFGVGPLVYLQKLFLSMNLLCKSYNDENSQNVQIQNSDINPSESQSLSSKVRELNWSKWLPCACIVGLLMIFCRVVWPLSFFSKFGLLVCWCLIFLFLGYYCKHKRILNNHLFLTLICLSVVNFCAGYALSNYVDRWQYEPMGRELMSPLVLMLNTAAYIILLILGNRLNRLNDTKLVSIALFIVAIGGILLYTWGNAIASLDFDCFGDFNLFYFSWNFGCLCHFPTGIKPLFWMDCAFNVIPLVLIWKGSKKLENKA